MVVNDENLEKIQELGLNSYEAKLWTALLSRGVSTAGELSDIANVPRSRSYDVLESLEKKGFVVMKIGKPIKYIAVPPKEAVNRVKQNIQEEAKKESKKIDRLKDSDVIDELKLLYKEGVDKRDPAEISSHVKGSKTVKDKARQLIKNSEDTIYISIKAETLNEEYPLIKNALQKASERNVDIKIACKNLDNFKKPQELNQYADVKNIDVDARFWIADDDQIMFSITGPNQHNFENAISINTEFFANGMKNLFQKAWQTR